MPNPEAMPDPENETKHEADLTLSEPPEPQRQKRQIARRRRVQTILKRLGLPSGGIGVVATIGLLQAGQPLAAVLTGLATVGVVALAIAAKFFSDLGTRVLDRIEARLERWVDPLADWLVGQLEQSVVGLWWRFTPQFRGAYYRSLRYLCRTYVTQGLKTPGTFSPDLEKVFVPLRIAPKSVEQSSAAIVPQPVSTETLSIWTLLARSRREPAYQRLVVIGAPGSGKSTLLRHLTLTYARNAQRQQNRRVPTLIPVLLLLHQVRDRITSNPAAPNSNPAAPNSTDPNPANPNPVALPDLIAEQVARQPSDRPLKPSPHWFADRLQRGKCLVMLDGLDEVADETQRQQVSRWVDTQMQTYPRTTWILTSRPFGYQQARLQQARTSLEVQPFNLRQVEQFLRRWYLQNESLRQARQVDAGVRAEADRKATDLIGRIQNYPALAAMALNPLLLTMIATVHDNRGALPGNRVSLYDEICDVLLVRRQEAKDLSQSLPFKANQIKANQKQSVLQVLALALMERETNTFDLETGSTLIQAALHAVSGEAMTPAAFLNHVETVSGLLLEREAGQYQFAHLSLQEYLAAAQIKETHQEARLIAQIENPWWHETIRLYAIQSDASDLIEAALVRRSVSALMVAYDCLEEGKSVRPQVRRQLERMSLVSEYPEIARLAARVKLARRLSRLVRIDDAVQIDASYLTKAEYQLFLENCSSNTNSHYSDYRTTPPNLPLARGGAEGGGVLSCSAQLENWYNSPRTSASRPFQPDEAQQPVTGISFEAALAFCCWLSLAFPDEQTSSYYRLPTAAEVERVPADAYPNLTAWTLGSESLQEQGLRLVRATLDPAYEALQNALAEKNWEHADRETEVLLLQLAPPPRQRKVDVTLLEVLPCGCLETIDQLWLHYSQGQFGLSIQVGLWQSIGRETTEQFQRLGQVLSWDRFLETGGLPSVFFPGCWSSDEALSQVLGGDASLEIVVLPRALPPGFWPQRWLLRASDDRPAKMMVALVERFTRCDIQHGWLQRFTFPVMTLDRQGTVARRDWVQSYSFSERLGRGVSLEMVAIPGGTFVMGSPENELGRFEVEGPQQPVAVTPFFIGKYPVTQVQWRTVAALPQVERPLKSNPARFEGEDRPVEQVSWWEAMEFCARLSQETGRQYRLPSEAEWEYACRAGTVTPFHFGETITTEVANYDGNDFYGGGPQGKYRQETTPVGYFKVANGFGLYDMHGNVLEWCAADTWHAKDEGAPSDGSAWVENDYRPRLLRGGSWIFSPRLCRSAYHNWDDARFRSSFIGFRVACSATRTS